MNYSVLSKYRGELMGLAILFVVMFHVYMSRSNFFFPLRRMGNVGVDMFLFVSGMGLWFSWMRSRLGRKLNGCGALPVAEALKHFFARRYLRIYPVWLLVASVFYISKYIENPGGGYSPDIPNLVANILFNWSFWRADALTFWYVPATMMLYNFAPPYMELVRNRPAYRWLPLAFVLLAAMVQYVPLFHNSVGHIEIFFSRIAIFFIGINMGEAVMERRTLPSGSMGMLVILFASSLWLCLRLEYIGHGSFPLFMERMAYIPLAVSALFLECKLLDYAPAWALRVLAFLGSISLEIYLIHIEFVLRPLGRYNLGYGLTLLCVLLVSVPAAYILRRAVDFAVSAVSKVASSQFRG